MNFLFNAGLLILGFILLIKGADFFVDGASKIADRFGIPQLVIGLTIVAFGTSAPEAAISISSAIKGSTGIAVGNVVGSNILNILLILGITSCITVLHVKKSTVNIEIPFVILVTTVMVVIGGTKGELDFMAGIILWILFAAFFVYLIIIAKKGENTEDEEKIDGKDSSLIKLIILTVIGMAGIIIGSDFTVDGATEIARIFGMTERLIGLTIVAFGTSLPELITSVMAGLKGKADIAIGNIVGSNIFNILFVLGTTCIIKAVPYESKFVIDGIVAIAAAAVLFLSVFRKKQLGRRAGVTMLICYLGYFVYLLASQPK